MLKVYVQRGGADESRPPGKEVASMRRILLVLTVTALMAVMLTVMAAPAFAVSDQGGNKYCEIANQKKPAHARGAPVWLTPESCSL
jgi:hypothetical protein